MSMRDVCSELKAVKFKHFFFSGDTRTSDEVRKVIKTAKLHESELTETTQILRFPESSKQNDNLRLMLLDDNLLKQIESGNELIFKGKRYFMQ